jgi:hypothetical protein
VHVNLLHVLAQPILSKINKRYISCLTFVFQCYYASVSHIYVAENAWLAYSWLTAYFTLTVLLCYNVYSTSEPRKLRWKIFYFYLFFKPD